MTEIPEQQAELFVVSDGTGETAAAAVRAVMAQFRVRWRMRLFPAVRHDVQIRELVQQAAERRALVVFTLVDPRIVERLQDLAGDREVSVVDLLGPLLSGTARYLGAEPQSLPGLLRKFSAEYFQRVEAVEFAVRHDDGANLRTLYQADIVLTGVSRTSKTPLSMCLAQRGFKTGNVPLVPGLEPPRELLELDRRHVFGLVVDAELLVGIRQARMRGLGVSPYRSYAEPEQVRFELRQARKLYRERGWRMVDISDRAVEEGASRIVELYQRARE